MPKAQCLLDLHATDWPLKRQSTSELFYVEREDLRGGHHEIVVALKELTYDLIPLGTHNRGRRNLVSRLPETGLYFVQRRSGSDTAERPMVQSRLVIHENGRPSWSS
jgi:hypothetical protein